MLLGRMLLWLVGGGYDMSENYVRVYSAHPPSGGKLLGYQIDSDLPIKYPEGFREGQWVMNYTHLKDTFQQVSEQLKAANVVFGEGVTTNQQRELTDILTR